MWWEGGRTWGYKHSFWPCMQLGQELSGEKCCRLAGNQPTQGSWGEMALRDLMACGQHLYWVRETIFVKQLANIYVPFWTWDWGPGSGHRCQKLVPSWRGWDWWAETGSPCRAAAKVGTIPRSWGLRQCTKAESMARGKQGQGCNSWNPNKCSEALKGKH